MITLRDIEQSCVSFKCSVFIILILIIKDILAAKVNYVFCTCCIDMMNECQLWIKNEVLLLNSLFVSENGKRK